MSGAARRSFQETTRNGGGWPNLRKDIHPFDDQLGRLLDARVSHWRSYHRPASQCRGCILGAHSIGSTKVLPASFRRAKEAESARIQRLTEAATSHHAIFAALTAEATRLRSRQLIHLFISFVCISTMVLTLVVLDAGEVERILAIPLVIFLMGMSFFHYSSGLDSARRAARLDTALREVQRNLELPVMD